MKHIRKNSVAGLFYPANPQHLTSDIEHYFSQVTQTEHFEKIAGIVAPHAGYLYSGLTAAFAYKTLQNLSFRTVIVLSPSHHEYFQGISIYPGEGYETPLGIVPINREVAHALSENTDEIMFSESGHRKEHAIEVQLPFLQNILPAFDFVPVVMGDQHPSLINILADKLKTVLDDSMLLIASSDLSHYHSRKIASEMDKKVAASISSYNFNMLNNDLSTRKCEACGGGLIVSLMKALHRTGKEKMTVVHRRDSGDVTGDYSEVVGYLSAVNHQ